jgi:hypothetical protein
MAIPALASASKEPSIPQPLSKRPPAHHTPLVTRKAILANVRNRKPIFAGPGNVRLAASQPFGAARAEADQSKRTAERSILSRAGWSTIQPTSNGRRRGFEPGGPLVEIRVAVEDDTRVPELVRRLARLFDRSSISFDRSRNEVRVASEWESRTVMGVVEIVQAWLSEDGAESATLSLGDRSYVLGRATPLTVIP